MHVSNRKKLLNGVHSRSSLARSITYQSRMSYLKSREGDSSGKRLLGKRIIGEKPSPSFTLGAPLKPCQPDKLLPPMQLMTKEKSFRHLYRKHHPPAQICKMNFLKKKEDPNMKRLKDEIYAKIRASDLASEQLDRDKEAWQSNRNEKVKISCEIVATNASSELSGNEENQNRSHAENDPERSRDHGSGFAVSSNSETAGLIARNEEIETYGDRFSFLAEWKKETKGFHKQNE